MTILAVAGILAAAWHVVRAAFRLLWQEASGFWANELSRTHARRGDVTALEASKRQAAMVAVRRRRVLAEGIGWLALLVAPPLTPWTAWIYAGSSAFWALPYLRRRSR